MIVSTIQVKTYDGTWYLVHPDGTIAAGPFAHPYDAIKARQELARIDVTATAAKVGRKQQREQVKEEWS